MTVRIQLKQVAQKEQTSQELLCHLIPLEAILHKLLPSLSSQALNFLRQGQQANVQTDVTGWG